VRLVIEGIPQTEYGDYIAIGHVDMRIDEYNSFNSLLPRYSKALSRLERSGVCVAQQCRLRKYERRLSQLVVDPQVAVGADLVFAATFDLREIVEHLPVSIDASTLELLSKLTGGNDHPDDDTSAAARDAQYELYLGTVLRRAGIPVRHGAPDITASWQGEEFFIEAKRPGSPKRLDDRLRSAVHQLRKLPRPGVVAISADQLLRPSGGLLAVELHEQLALAVDSLLRSFIIKHSHILRNRLGKEPFAALLWTARLPARIGSTGHSALGTSLLLETDLPDSPEAAFASVAMDAYLKAQNGNHLHAGG
jgi:hypothetical protein